MIAFDAHEWVGPAISTFAALLAAATSVVTNRRATRFMVSENARSETRDVQAKIVDVLEGLESLDSFLLAERVARPHPAADNARIVRETAEGAVERVQSLQVVAGEAKTGTLNLRRDRRSEQIGRALVGDLENLASACAWPDVLEREYLLWRALPIAIARCEEYRESIQTARPDRAGSGRRRMRRLRRSQRRRTDLYGPLLMFKGQSWSNARIEVRLACKRNDHYDGFVATLTGLSADLRQGFEWDARLNDGVSPAWLPECGRFNNRIATAYRISRWARRLHLTVERVGDSSWPVKRHDRLTFVLKDRGASSKNMTTLTQVLLSTTDLPDRVSANVDANASASGGDRR